MCHVPFARVNATKNGLFVRLPKKLSQFLERLPEADVVSDGFYAFRSKVKGFVVTLKGGCLKRPVL